MAIFYRSTRKTWYIRVTIDKKRFYCYRPDTRSDTFKSKKAATAYEPLFIASILREKHKDKLYINDDYLEGYYQFMRTRLKPSTFYGYKNTFEKYWNKFFYGLDVSTITNTTLETFNAKVSKSPKNHNGKSASGKFFVRYLKRTKPELDMENIAASSSEDTPKTSRISSSLDMASKSFLFTFEL